MRILITSALFPPDVADPAPYIKELATRFASTYDVSILAYGKIPENIAGVEIHMIAKEQPTLRRLRQFFRVLRSQATENDVVIVNNAPSTELPALFASYFSTAKWYLLESDQKITYTGWKKFLHQLVKKRLQTLNITLPLPRPEQHPFTPPSEAQWKEYEQSWQMHLKELAVVLHSHDTSH